MFNTFKNLSRKSEKYGDVHFISFLGAILSRLAYLNDNKFLTFGKVEFFITKITIFKICFKPKLKNE